MPDYNHGLWFLMKVEGAGNVIETIWKIGSCKLDNSDFAFSHFHQVIITDI